MDTTHIGSTFFTYISIHLLFYTFIGRRLSFFRKEKAIFLYHFIPSIIFTIFILRVYSSGQFKTEELGWMIGVQGIYSLSFLELWALSEGGFSLRILYFIHKTPSQTDFSAFEQLGAKKKLNRIESLKKLGLVENCQDSYTLTPRGKFVASLLQSLLSLVNHKETG
jgi:hypothetical protein